MKIWLIKIGEPLPNNPFGDRLLRAGMIAEALVKDGHEVTWWTSNFDHSRKSFLQLQTPTIIDANYRLIPLVSIGYKKNTSLRRLMEHRQLARQFAKMALLEEKPDVILCSYPTPDFAAEAVKIGKLLNVPVILDIRDLVPDVLLEKLPKSFRFLGRLLLYPLFAKARFAIRNATGLVGLTEEFLEWARFFGKRLKGPCEQVFAMGYSSKQLINNNDKKADTFWQEKGITAESFNVCFFGTIGPYFDFNPIVDAAKKLTEYKNIKFVLCGDGPDFEKLQMKTSDLPNVWMTGWINQSQIESLLKLSSVGIAPYVPIDNFTKNVANKFAEYLSEGLPILSGIDGVIGTYIKQNSMGFCYNHDPDKLVNVLLEWSKDKALTSRMSCNAKSFFEEHLVAEQIYFKLSKWLTKVVEENKKEQPI